MIAVTNPDLFFIAMVLDYRKGDYCDFEVRAFRIANRTFFVQLQQRCPAASSVSEQHSGGSDRHRVSSVTG
jgi:hypothetical protein